MRNTSSAPRRLLSDESSTSYWVSTAFARRRLGLVHIFRELVRCVVPSWDTGAMRFMTLADVAEELNVTVRQAYSLVRSGQLRGVQIGGRGQWRVEVSELESYIQRLYEHQTNENALND